MKHCLSRFNKKIAIDPNLFKVYARFFSKENEMNPPPKVILKNIDEIHTKSNLIKDLIAISKLKLSVTNAAVSVISYTNYCVPTLTGLACFSGGTLCMAVTSQVLNQLIERENDKKMLRTRNRPLPKERLSTHAALILAAACMAMAILFYSQIENSKKAIFFSSLIIAVYIMLYTVGKSRTKYAVHVGAVAGALPALLGSYVATGSLLTPDSLAYGAFILSWQYPHFYGIMYKNMSCYKNAGFKFLERASHKELAVTHMYLALIFQNLVFWYLMLVKDFKMNFAEYGLSLMFIASMKDCFSITNQFKKSPITPVLSKKLLISSYYPFSVVTIYFIYKSVKFQLQKKS